MAKWPYNTSRWQKVRQLKLKQSPLCEDCYSQGKLVIANTVDHIHAISNGGPAFPGLDGLRSLCPSCHSKKTARGPEAGAAKFRPRGCDETGQPVDPNHQWNKAAM